MFSSRLFDIIISLLLGVIAVCSVVSTVFKISCTESSIVTVPSRSSSTGDEEGNILYTEDIPTTQQPIFEDTGNECPKMIEREFWNAQPPSKQLSNLTHPVPNLIILHTAGKECFTQTTCVLQTRLMQTLHIESFGWDDIGYSFLIGGDGFVYVGRGWNKKGAFTYGWNSKSVGLAFIGTYNDKEPSEKMMTAARKLLNCGKALGVLSNNVHVLGHRQVSKTLSPGDKLYELITKWPEWVAIP